MVRVDVRVDVERTDVVRVGVGVVRVDVVSVMW